MAYASVSKTATDLSRKSLIVQQLHHKSLIYKILGPPDDPCRFWPIPHVSGSAGNKMVTNWGPIDPCRRYEVATETVRLRSFLPRTTVFSPGAMTILPLPRLPRIGVRLAAIRPQKRVAVARNKTEVVRLESRPGYQTAPESGKGQLISRDIGDESSGH